jgi:hypothetical protein
MRDLTGARECATHAAASFNLRTSEKAFLTKFGKGMRHDEAANSHVEDTPEFWI